MLQTMLGSVTSLRTRTVWSSIICFGVSTFFAWLNAVPDVTIGSFLCLTTSVLYHGTRLPTWRRIDMAVVNSVGGYFTTCCIFEYGVQKTAAMWAYVFISSAMTLYGYQRQQSVLFSERHHWLVHVFSNAGVCCYVLAVVY